MFYVIHISYYTVRLSDSFSKILGPLGREEARLFALSNSWHSGQANMSKKSQTAPTQVTTDA